MTKFSSLRWLPLSALFLVACQTTHTTGKIPSTPSTPSTQVARAAYEKKPADPYFAIFNPRLAPQPGPLLLHTGDRLAIVGDSITST